MEEERIHRRLSKTATDMLQHIERLRLEEEEKAANEKVAVTFAS